MSNPKAIVNVTLLLTLLTILPHTITSVKYNVSCTTKVPPPEGEGEGEEPVESAVHFYSFLGEIENVRDWTDESSTPSSTGETTIKREVSIVSASVNPLVDEKCDVIVVISNSAYIQYQGPDGNDVFVTDNDNLQMTIYQRIDQEKCDPENEELQAAVFDSANIMNRPINKGIPSESDFSCDMIRVDRRLVLI